jgi:hypothetical protein
MRLENDNGVGIWVRRTRADVNAVVVYSSW